MYEVNGKTYPCCTSVTMGIIGGKWKSVILFHLMEGPLRYSELRRNLTIVTERTLSLQLKNLEADGIVKRTVYTSKPPLKVEYALTKMGQSLMPLLRDIAKWGEYMVAEQGTGNVACKKTG